MITLDRGRTALIRHMLLTGLANCGELDRLRNAAAIDGDAMPEFCRQEDPIGNACTLALFAEVRASTLQRLAGQREMKAATRRGRHF